MSAQSIGFTDSATSGKAKAAIERVFSPEFRNRLDAIVTFRSLSPLVMEEIVEPFTASSTARAGRPLRSRCRASARVAVGEAITTISSITNGDQRTEGDDSRRGDAELGAEHALDRRFRLALTSRCR